MSNKRQPTTNYPQPTTNTARSLLACTGGFSYSARQITPMNKAIRFKLFLMMVLEFFIWGAWLPLIFGYLPSLGFKPWEQSWILNAFPIAAIVGMFFSNQFADRNFAAEKFLAFSHLIGGVAILSLVWVQSFWPFFLLMLVHCLLYVPTISITN
jgi:MFS family permease